MEGRGRVRVRVRVRTGENRAAILEHCYWYWYSYPYWGQTGTAYVHVRDPWEKTQVRSTTQVHTGSLRRPAPLKSLDQNDQARSKAA